MGNDNDKDDVNGDDNDKDDDDDKYDDNDDAHGGCPVLVGSKWITNKWVMIMITMMSMMMTMIKMIF